MVIFRSKCGIGQAMVEKVIDERRPRENEKD